MKIAILGGGSIGSAFAYHFSRFGGHEVTVITHPGSTRSSHLVRDAAIVTTDGERSEVRVASIFDESAHFDLVIVSLSIGKVEAVLPGLHRS